MKLIKTFPKQNILNTPGCTFSIYELEEFEMKFSEGKKYLLNQTLSEYALERMSKVDMITRFLRESTYVYGVAFCDTVYEAELYYKCCLMEIQLRRARDTVRDLQESLVSFQNKPCFTTKVSVFNDKFTKE